MQRSAPQKRGYPIEIFRDVSVPIAKFLCVLCHLVLNNPVQRFCGHRYCKECIESANELSSGSETACPACAADDVVDEEGFHDEATRQVISQLD